MSKRLKNFVLIFILVGLATSLMWYFASGNWEQAIKLGVMGGFVVSLIVNLAIPFIKGHKKRNRES